MASGINTADIYGPSFPGTPRKEPTTTAQASGQVTRLPGAPVISWLGIVIALVILRVVWEMAPASARIGG